MFWMPGISWPFILILRLRHDARYVIERAGHAAALLVEPHCLDIVIFLSGLAALFFFIHSLLFQLLASVDMLGIQ